MTKQFVATFCLLTLLGIQHIYAQELVWAKQIGGTGLDEGRSTVVDAMGNVYTTGRFQNTIDFDPGAGTFNLTSAGSYDVFISKLDSDGNLIWAVQLGGTNYDVGYSIALDVSGNIYTTGSFRGTGDFDPGVGTFNLTSTGANDDIFVSKLDADGNFIWALSMGGTSPDVSYFITLDPSGNVYTTGIFAGSADFDPGAGSSNLVSAGTQDIFISKLDVSGNFVWAKQLGGTSGDYGYSIAVDNAGNVYSTGRFQSTADFNPGAGTFNMTSAGNDDIYVSKLDPSGNFVWARQFSGTGFNIGYSIALDAAGNVITTGFFNETADFDPGAGSFNLTSGGGSTDAFITKLDPSGNLIWAKQFTGTESGVGYSVTLDASDNIYTTGVFAGATDFDPGAGTFTMTAAGINDVFISKIDASGNFIWARQLGGSDNDIGYSLDLDISGNIYATGYFNSTADFDPGVNNFDLTSAGSSDAFVHKLNQCTHTYGTDIISACDSYTWIDGITYTSSNNSATHTVPNSTGCDSIITLNLTINSASSGTDVISACNSYTWIDGITYTSSNNSATHTVPNSAGCDSVITLNLTINSASSGTDVISACDSYTWIDGITYTSSNNSATHTVPNSAGCDSVITLNLTINTSSSGTDIISACDSYTWIDGITYTSSNNSATHTVPNSAGCDSVITLNLTINSASSGTDVISACDSYTWIDGITYTSSNNSATHTVPNSAGCDSIVTLNLTINSVSDLSVSSSGITISANTPGATYQWLNCDNSFAVLPGETGQVFTASSNGSYAVEIMENGCTDTSLCVTIANVGVFENDFIDELIVFPNPGDGNFSIDLGSTYEHVQIQIYDAQGNLIRTEAFIQQQLLFLKLEIPAGIYPTTILADDKRAIIRLIKN